MLDKTTVRHCAVDSFFYPSSARRLDEMVWRYLDSAHIPPLGRVRAVITPHAAYQYSGVIAAHSFKALATLLLDEYTVYLLGPAHYQPVHGVGLSSAANFETPLGQIHVAVERVEELLGRGKPYHLADSAHLPEHCLEVELPFLQRALPNVRIVPMLFDDEADPAVVAADLAEICAKDAHSLIVVSSDLSHYHPYFEAVRLDQALIDAVIQENLERASIGEACGQIPILALLTVAKALEWTPLLLAYRNSGQPGDIDGNPLGAVVGYASLVFSEEKGMVEQ